MRDYVYITGTADHVSTPTGFVPSRRADAGTNDSPTLSDLASGLLERGGRRALLSSSRSLAATPPECGGSHTLQLPRPLCPRTGKRVGWSGECSGGAATYQFGRLGGIFGTGEFSYFRKSSSTSGYSTFKYESYNTKKKLGTTRGEPYGESTGRRTRGRSHSSPPCDPTLSRKE